QPSVRPARGPRQHLASVPATLFAGVEPEGEPLGRNPRKDLQEPRPQIHECRACKTQGGSSLHRAQPRTRQIHHNFPLHCQVNLIWRRYYIQQGKVKLTVVSEQGKEAVAAILGPGHFFGEGCLNGHPLRIATTRALEECLITRLEKAIMIATIHNEPEFSELFMSYLLTRNSRIEEDLMVPSRMLVGISGVISGKLKVPDQAARSIC